MTFKPIRLKTTPGFTLVILMITIALDFMSFLLTLPLFPALFLAKDNLLVTFNSTEAVKYFYYALALAGWPLGSFFGTAFLGLASDQFGRKKILVLSLSVVAIVYLLQIISINLHSAFLFIIARFIHGFFGGNYDVVQAAVIDISLPEHKIKNMGLIALASSIGVVFGPIISTLTLSPYLANWFTIATPFWIAAVLTFCNMVCISLIFNETYIPNKRQSIKFYKIFTAVMFMFNDARVIKITIVFFFFILGWALYIQQVPIVMQKIFNFNSYQLGKFFVVLGVGFAFAVSCIQPILTKQLRLKQICIYCMPFLIFFVLLAGFMPMLQIEWIAVFNIAVCHVCVYTSLLAMASNAVEGYEQGKVMGGMGAINSLAVIVAASFNAVFSLLNVLLPLIIAGIVYFLSVFLVKKVNEN